jgi:hypothetical protein
MTCTPVSARYTTRAAEVSYEISIATSILFDGFGGMDRKRWATFGG